MTAGMGGGGGWRVSVIEPFLETAHPSQATFFLYSLYFSYRTPSLNYFKQSMGARSGVGIGLSYRPARLHMLAELIPKDLFLGSLKV
jgi:hypothetical protein